MKLKEKRKSTELKVDFKKIIKIDVFNYTKDQNTNCRNQEWRMKEDITIETAYIKRSHRGILSFIIF